MGRLRRQVADGLSAVGCVQAGVGGVWVRPMEGGVWVREGMRTAAAACPSRHLTPPPRSAARPPGTTYPRPGCMPHRPLLSCAVAGAHRSRRRRQHAGLQGRRVGAASEGGSASARRPQPTPLPHPPPPPRRRPDCCLELSPSTPRPSLLFVDRVHTCAGAHASIRRPLCAPAPARPPAAHPACARARPPARPCAPPLSAPASPPWPERRDAHAACG